MKSRYIVVASVLLFFIGISFIVLIFTNHTNMMIERVVKETEYDLGFLTEHVKKDYLNKDFVAIEQAMAEWVHGNDITYSLNAIAANGYVLFSYQSDKPALHKRKLQKAVTQDNRLLLTISFERDLSSVVMESESLRNKVIFAGLGFGLLLGFITWLLLHKFAFSPLEQEISRRQEAESALKLANEALEIRVENRTKAIQKLSSVVEQTDDMVVITDPGGMVEYANPSFINITGYSAREIIGSNIGMIKSGLLGESFYKGLWETILGGDSFQDIFINRKKSGEIYYEEKTITPLKDIHGRILNYVSTSKDISERIQIQEKLHHLATHDVLTGLPNKLMVLDRLTHAIEQSRLNSFKIAVLFLDLDQFKHINDSLGHITGDSLLKTVGAKLQECIRSSDTVGRFGGDEFTIIMEGLKDINEVNITAQQILDTVSEPLVADGYEIVSSASIGVTIFPDDGDNINTLLKNADVAMYRAKSKGGNSVQFYTQDMTTLALQRMEIQHRLNHALERNEFLLHYQPRIDVKTGMITGMEALIRWDNPDIGFQNPESFIPILEETGKIIEVGQWVMQEACRFNTGLAKKGIKPLRISVNLSARQFHDENLLQKLETMFSQCSLEPKFLEIEITESLLVDDIENTIIILEKIHQLGVYLSIDDFGTGYSSMSYLKKFPIDAIKIDRTFVSGLPDDKDDMAIVNATIALGKNLGLQLIAEGVETAEQAAFLQLSECNELQGYYFSRPLPGDKFIEFLLDYNDNIKSGLGENKE